MTNCSKVVMNSLTVHVWQSLVNLPKKYDSRSKQEQSALEKEDQLIWPPYIAYSIATISSVPHKNKEPLLDICQCSKRCDLGRINAQFEKPT